LAYISALKDQKGLAADPVQSSQLKPQDCKKLHHQIRSRKPCASLSQKMLPNQSPISRQGFYRLSQISNIGYLLLAPALLKLGNRACNDE
jgi:hypothetical protein